MTLYEQLLIPAKIKSPTGHMMDGWAVGCLQGCKRPAIKRMLCNTCYQRAYRDGSLWQFPNTSFLDDRSMTGQIALDEMISWIFEYNYDELIIGLQEYVEGMWKVSVSDKFTMKIGNDGYKLGSLCTECNLGKEYSRGLCRECYNDNKYLKHHVVYPTKDYVKNVKAHVWFVLNFHMERVQDIGMEFGVTINVVH